ncbi:2-oxo acid dehydrogenase subunit E2 [Sphingobium sp.]|uniref:2-oxo acid dehydrogenase subunit E2 n=1 Tax=Sphingobium sp. TaxID=1912891 RepID=UPI002C10C732|nr:2-oxo acid dehydrogenase subunit E2 [Sphingobium sp.]HUD93316.1 2-oxo acid dehydrogenase subunit E2 [Sphingobium sp.]
MAVTDIVKLTGLRGIIAQKMSESLAKTAQLSFFCDVDVTALIQAREAWKAAGVKIGYEDLIAKTISYVMRDFPAFNGVETPAGIELHEEVHVGCAIALPGALVAPAIANVERLALPDIAATRQDLVARAKLGKLTIAELTGATVTITNLGLTRVEHFTPILTYPQQAIIGLGRIAPKPWVDVDEQTVVVRPVMGLSLTVDHRTIDGGPAGDFLGALAQALESAAGLTPQE